MKISILIASKDEEKYIEKCLDSLIEQDFPKNEYEILVIDGKSKDRTREIVNEIIKKNKKSNIRLLHNEKIIPPAAWEVGLENARGEFILIFGSHSTAPKDFLKKNWETWEKYNKKISDLAGVGGRYIIKEFENFTQKLGYVLLNSFFSGSSGHKRIETTRETKTIVFGMYKKEIIKKIGGFDDDLKIGGDLEINLRLNKLRYKLITNPNIEFDYYPRSDFKKMLKQIWNYGIAKGLFLRKGYFIPKAIIAPLFLVYFLGLLLFSDLLVYIIPILVYVILNFLFSIYNSIKHGEIRFLITLPLLYFYVHLSSGISIILGYLIKQEGYL
ncbi:MAG: glycosyltransferase [Candidatus ainarchaeum sp.]|nr:glycosyltransferase [Candidatus ainarchaeum sp.]